MGLSPLLNGHLIWVLSSEWTLIEYPKRWRNGFLQFVDVITWTETVTFRYHGQEAMRSYIFRGVGR
uniref:Uncharacterized protein n=1 Tax=Picea sitchensis TaxID=3332 RepID=A0A6B9XVY5_PICSI|nr:hypothetical protein Q903MT_gene3839 [Picea sitchensis]